MIKKILGEWTIYFTFIIILLMILDSNVNFNLPYKIYIGFIILMSVGVIVKNLDD